MVIEQRTRTKNGYKTIKRYRSVGTAKYTIDLSM